MPCSRKLSAFFNFVLFLCKCPDPCTTAPHHRRGLRRGTCVSRRRWDKGVCLMAATEYPGASRPDPLRAGGVVVVACRAAGAPSPFGLPVSPPAVSGVSPVDVSGRCCRLNRRLFWPEIIASSIIDCPGSGRHHCLHVLAVSKSEGLPAPAESGSSRCVPYHLIRCSLQILWDCFYILWQYMYLILQHFCFKSAMCRLINNRFHTVPVIIVDEDPISYSLSSLKTT